MEQSTPVRFFLGANSKRGFFSCYDSFTDPASGTFLWVIKGGPGNGKSTFMKRIGAAAEAAGEAVEYIHCSGDPDSLDAVSLPGLRVAYVDGTAPHVVEARCPGAASLYLDLGRFYDTAALAAKRAELLALTRRYQARYADAYAKLAAAAALLPRNAPGLSDRADAARVEKEAEGLAARELRRLNKRAVRQHRFLSAWSCKGYVSFRETLGALAERLCLLESARGLGSVCLERLAAAADARGCDQILCHDPLEPEKLEAVVLPECSLAFLAADGDPPADAPWRRLRLDPAAADAGRGDPDGCGRESGLLLRAAVRSLAEAKTLHDALEQLYHPHVDFAGVGALAEAHIRRLFPARAAQTEGVS